MNLFSIFDGLNPTLFGLGLVAFGLYQVFIEKALPSGITSILAGVSDIVHKRNDLPGQSSPAAKA